MIELHVTPGNLVTPDHIRDEEGRLMASVYETALTSLFQHSPEMLESLRDAVLFMQFLGKRERRLTDSEQRWLDNAVTLLRKIENDDPQSA